MIFIYHGVCKQKPLNRKNYGSIPHLLGSKLGATDKYVHEGQHRILTEKTRDKHDLVIVTEKYDGSNVGIAKVNGKIISLTRSGYLAETSPYRQHQFFADWVEKQKDRFGFINEGDRLVGEWLLQVHSTRYNIEVEPFIAFDYFTANNERMLYKNLIFNTHLDNIITPKILHIDNSAIPIDIAMNELMSKKWRHPIDAVDNPEGLVYRVERDGKFDFAAKYVRPGHEPGKYCIGIEEKDLIWNMNPELI